MKNAQKNNFLLANTVRVGKTHFVLDSLFIVDDATLAELSP